jgi:hypothetical protein
VLRLSKVTFLRLLDATSGRNLSDFALEMPPLCTTAGQEGTHARQDERTNRTAGCGQGKARHAACCARLVMLAALSAVHDLTGWTDSILYAVNSKTVVAIVLAGI